MDGMIAAVAFGVGVVTGSGATVLVSVIVGRWLNRKAAEFSVGSKLW